jgi:excisionase family DNA binding protein
MTTTELPPSWSKAEVAAAWGISPKAIDRLVRNGQVGYYRAGRSRRFYTEHVQQIRAALEVEAQPVSPGALAGLTRQSSARRRSA